jgi:hypothetical protein
MRTKVADKLLIDLDNAFSRMRGCTITEQEYNLIIQRFEELRMHVLYPAAMVDIHKDYKDET